MPDIDPMGDTFVVNPMPNRAVMTASPPPAVIDPMGDTNLVGPRPSIMQTGHPGTETWGAGLGRWVDTSIQQSPNAGNIVPLSNEPGVGLRLAMPNILRSRFTEGPQIKDGQLVVPGATINPETGTLGVTPETSATVYPRPLRFGAAPNPLPRIMELVNDPYAPKPPPVVSPSPLFRQTDRPPWRPATPEIQAIRDNLYKLVDESGAVIKPEYGNQGLMDALKKLRSPGPLSEGTVAAPVKQIQVSLQNAKDKPLSLQDYARFDKDLTGLAHETQNPTVAGQLRDVQRGLRNHLENAKEKDVTGSADDFRVIDQARKTHSQLQKVEDAEDMIYNARLRSMSGGSEGGSVSTQLERYLKGDQSGTLTDMERAAAQAALDRGNMGAVLGGVGRIANPIVGGLLGGPWLAAGSQGIRSGAGMWADALARSRMQGYLDVLREGVPQRPDLIPPPPRQ